MAVHLLKRLRNRLAWSFAGSALLLSISLGCQLRLGDSKDSSDAIQLSDMKAQCIGQSLKVLQKFFAATPQANEITESVQCLQGALKLFSEFGRGTQDRSSFTVQELQAFLKKNFLGSIEIGPGFYSEMMEIKVLVMGGDHDHLTKVELDQFIDDLDLIRDEAIAILPHMPLLMMHDGLSPSEDEINQAHVTLNEVLSKFALFFGRSQKPYQFSSFKRLIQEMKGIYKVHSEWTGPDWALEKLPLISAAKEVLLASSGDEIKPNEWRVFISKASTLYSVMLRVHYQMAGQNLWAGSGLEVFERISQKLIPFIEDSIRIHSASKIPTDKILNLITQIEKTNTYQFPVQNSTIAKLLPLAFNKVFNPYIKLATKVDSGLPLLDQEDPLSIRGVRQPQDGLTLYNFQEMKSRWLGFIEAQKMWTQIENKNKASAKPIPIDIVAKQWAQFRPRFKETWLDIKNLFEVEIPSTIESHGVMQFDQRSKLTIDRNSFFQGNWKQMIVRVLGNAYISDPVGLHEKGLLLSQFAKVFFDLREVGIDLNLIAPSDDQIYKTGFAISNMFLFSSDGDDRIGFNEAVELFIFTFSAATRSKLLRVDLNKNCDPQKPLDTFGRPKLTAECWRSRFKENYLTIMDPYPNWIALVKSPRFTAANFAELTSHLERASRRADNQTGDLLGTQEMDKPFAIQQYIEALFARWDTDQDGVLSVHTVIDAENHLIALEGEAGRAFYLIEKILRDKSGFTEKSDLWALYTYMLANGKSPDKKKLGDVMAFVSWKSDPWRWETEARADRFKVSKIFAELASGL